MSAPPLFIVPSIATGGAELQLMLQLAGLRRRGLAPRLMILSDRVAPDLLAQAGLPPDHVAILGLPSAVLDKLLLRRCPTVLGPAARFVVGHGCDRAVALLPAAHFFSRLLKLALLARAHRVRLIQYHHSEENALNPRDTAGKWLFFAVNQALARACDSAHWHVSEQVRADITASMATCGDAVLFNTCDMDTPGDTDAARALLHDAGCDSAYTILLPGRLHAVKGHALLIEAARRLVSAERLGTNRLRLLFAGEGPERGRIAAAVAAAGLADHVVFLGTVPHAALLALYSMVNLVAVPSLSEGFGIVAIEALSRQSLLLASDAAGLREVIRPGVNGFQFPAGDTAALHRALADLWRRRNEVLIDRAAAAHDVRLRFGPELHLDRLLELLEAVDEHG